MKRIIYILIAAALFSCTKPVILKDARINQKGYFQFGKIPERDFYFDYTIGDSLELVWDQQTGGSFAPTAPTAYDKYLFMPDLMGRVNCFELESGKDMGMELNKGAVNSSVVLNKFRMLYMLNNYDEEFSTFIYYDYYLPQLIKEKKFPAKFKAEPIYTGNSILYLNTKGVLYKINLIGEVDWKLETNEITYSSPAMHNGKIVFGNRKGELLVADESSGKIIYREKISNGFDSYAAIAEESILLGDNDGILYSISLNNYKINWTVDTHSKIIATPVHHGNEIYVSNLSGLVYCVDKFTGRKKWIADTKGVLNTTAILFNDYLVQPDQNKKLHFIDISDGKITKSMKFDYRVLTSPMFYNNKLFIGIDRGYFYAYRSAGNTNE